LFERERNRLGGLLILKGLDNISSNNDDSSGGAHGVFISRSENGTGTFSKSDIRLRWNYGADGLSDEEALEQ
jgi:hypothetical protein